MSNKVNFDDYTEKYDQLLKEATNFFSSNEGYFAWYKVDIVRRQVHTNINSLLEFGCGIGRNIPFLRQTFPNAVIVGSDISQASLDIAKINNPGVEFSPRIENIESVRLFDVIFVAGVFHHIPVAQREDVLRTLFIRLLPGGLLFVFEHNPYNPVTCRIVSNCPYDADADLLKPSDLRHVLEQASFTIVNMAYCLFVPSRLSILVRLEGKLGWLPLGGQYWVQARRPI